MEQRTYEDETLAFGFAAVLFAGPATYGADASTDAEAVFIGRMKRERERRGWSQAGLAALVTKYGVEMHSTAITKLERVNRDDRRNLRLNEALAVASVLGLTPNAMLTDEDLNDGSLARERARSQLAEARRAQAEAEQAAERARRRAGECATALHELERRDPDHQGDSGPSTR